MALGDVIITGVLAPTDRVLDQYATHEDTFQKRGFRVVLTTVEMNAITVPRRGQGMLVLNLQDGIIYELQSNLTTWTPRTFSGSPTGAAGGDLMGTYPNPTLINSGVTAGTYGSATQVARPVVDAKGRITSITNVAIQITEAQVTGLSGTYIPLTQKGAANGVATLDGTSKVPVAQLPFSAIAYQGLYDASTNTPAILNGVGTAGDFYIANVIGNAYPPVNVTIVNQIVAYDGAVWQVGAVFGGGIQNITTDNGTLSGGTVILNSTAQIADSTGRRYMTEVQNAAADASNAPSGTNPFATIADIGGVIVGTQWLTPESVATGYTLGNGTQQTFASYGKTLGQAQADFPLAPITATSDLVDWAALYQASMLMANGSRQNTMVMGCYGAREYKINKVFNLPSISSKANVQYNYEGNGCVITQVSPTLSCIESLPANQTDALNVFALTNVSFHNMAIRNEGTAKGSGQAGIRIGARGVTITDVIASGFDLNYDLQFCLHAYLRKAFSLSPETAGHHIGIGTWTGAGLSSSASNCVNFTNCLSRAEPGANYCFWLEGSSDINLINCTCEGNVNAGALASQPKAGVFFDTRNSTVVRGTLNIEGMHLEQSFTEGGIWIKDREGCHDLRNISNQWQGYYPTANKNLIKLESYAGFVYANVYNFAHWLPDIQFYLGGSNCLMKWYDPWSIPNAAFLANPAYYPNYAMTQAQLGFSSYLP